MLEWIVNGHDSRLILCILPLLSAWLSVNVHAGEQTKVIIEFPLQQRVIS